MPNHDELFDDFDDPLPPTDEYGADFQEDGHLAMLETHFAAAARDWKDAAYNLSHAFDSLNNRFKDGPPARLPVRCHERLYELVEWSNAHVDRVFRPEDQAHVYSALDATWKVLDLWTKMPEERNPGLVHHWLEVVRIGQDVAHNQSLREEPVLREADKARMAANEAAIRERLARTERVTFLKPQSGPSR